MNDQPDTPNPNAQPCAVCGKVHHTNDKFNFWSHAVARGVYEAVTNWPQLDRALPPADRDAAINNALTNVLLWTWRDLEEDGAPTVAIVFAEVMLARIVRFLRAPVTDHSLASVTPEDVAAVLARLGLPCQSTAMMRVNGPSRPQ